jgi:hypothetical protein
MPWWARAIADGFSRCPAPHQHHIVGGVGERQRRQSGDQVFIDFRGGEVEAGQIPMDREFGGGELIPNRPHDSVGFLGFQQVVDEPFG